MTRRQGIAGLDTVLVAGGAVHAHFGDMPSATPEIAIGAASLPLERGPGPDRMTLVRAARLATEEIAADTRSIPAEDSPGAVYALWVNEMTDWALSGSQTLQLMLTQRDAPATVEIARPIRAEADGTPLRFFARIATHRAEATLRVIFTDPDTARREMRSVPFETAFVGGPAADGYQAVEIDLPARFDRCEVTLAVDYVAYRDDGTGIEPFLFLADLHVAPQVQGERALLIPHMGLGRDLPRDGVWMTAPLPCPPGPEDRLCLRAGAGEVAFDPPPAPRLTMRENFGHTLIFESDTRTDMVLCLDGEPVQRLTADVGDTVLRLDPRHLDGASHHLALRDASGTWVFWQSQHLVPAITTPADVMQRESAAPFPDAIFAQTARRHAALKALMADTRKGTDFAQAARALAVMEAGHDKVRLAPLSFPEVAEPDVSVVIPAHNKVAVTYLALCSLLVAHNAASFEVIVVDDASDDDTARLEEIVSGITVIHNAEAQRFIRACNAGAARARGRYVALLNNDVEVTVGWLDELIAAFDRFANVGLVGAKLIYPDGRLQDAGGIVWGSGNPWNYGNSDNPNDPRYCYARQADYRSGAALMTTREIWDEVGGLSAELEPMYFEDTDLAFKVRAAGYTTWFVPSAIVYHYEGMTSGTDVSTGFKRFQEVNRPKFKRKWARAYAGHGREGHRPDLEKDRGIVGRVLFVDYTTPRPDQDAGSYAALQEIRLVQSLGYKVTFLPMNLAHLGRYTEDLQKMGVEVIHAPFVTTPQEYITEHAADFDAFYLTRYYVAQGVLTQIRAAAPGAKVIFNNADLHFLREIRAAQAEGDPARLEQARRTRDEELAVIDDVDVVLSYNEVEHSVIEAYSEGHAKVIRCPWVVDLPETVPGLQARAGMSFLGSFRHHPNAEGIAWFVREVMPRVTAKVGPVPLSIYGAGMTDAVRALKSDLVDPVGFVADVAEAYDSHRIFIAPLRAGAGIKGKVLSALAHGVPCVLSPVAAEGIGLRSGHDCFVARTPDDWIAAIGKLQSDDALWQEMSENARGYMADAFSFGRGRDAMREAFESAGLFRSVA